MKPERAFIAERAIARHDPVLLRPGPSMGDLVPALARMSERMARMIDREARSAGVDRRTMLA